MSGRFDLLLPTIPLTSPARVFRRLARCPVGSAGNNVLKELRMASNLFCCHSCQAPFSAVLATYTDRFEHECPEKTNRLAAQKEKNRNSPVDENVSGTEGTQFQIATRSDLEEMFADILISAGGSLRDQFEKLKVIMGVLEEGDLEWIQGNYENGDSTKLTYAAAWAGRDDDEWTFVDPIPGWSGVDPWNRDTQGSTIGVWVFTKEPFNPVPEPATMLLLTGGLLGIAAFRRKFKK